MANRIVQLYMRFNFSYNDEDLAALRRLTPIWFRLARRMEPALILALCLSPGCIILAISRLDSVLWIVVGVIIVAVLRQLISPFPQPPHRTPRKTAVSFVDTFIEIQTESGWTRHCWKRIERVRRTRRHYALMFTRRTFFLLPIRAVEQHMELGNFERNLRELLDAGRNRMETVLFENPVDKSGGGVARVSYCTKAEELAGWKFGDRKNPAHKKLTLGDVLLVFSVFVFPLSVIPLAGPYASVGYQIIILLIGFLASAWVYYLLRRGFKWHWKRRIEKARENEQAIEIGPEGISCYTDLAIEHTYWRSVGAIEEAPQWILVFRQGNDLLHFIPKSAFGDSAKVREFVRLMQYHRRMASATGEAMNQLGVDVDGQASHTGETGNPYQSPLSC